MSEIKLPDYKLSEELMNSITHGIGAGLGIAALVLCLVKSAAHGNPWAVVASALYGAGVIMVFTISCIYHALARNKGKKVMRVIDHCDIFFMIACTYMPYCLVSLRGVAGWVLFGIVWGLAALGIVFNAVNLEKYSVPSTIVYVLLGWSIIVLYKPLVAAISLEGAMYLIGGGILYTIGAVLYALGKKKRYMHSVFHVIVIAGSILHFFSIYLYVI